MQRILPATLVIVLLVFSCAAAAVPLRERPTRGDVANATQEILARALQQVREKNAAGASATFARAFSSDGFARLPERQRFLAWSMAAAAAAEARDYASSLDWSTRAIALSSTSATEDLWRLRLEAAYQLENYPDSARSLVAIARQWPKALQDLKAQAITRVLSKLDKDRAHADVQFDLLCSLFDAGWTSDGQQPGWKWLQLARMWLERGKPDRAAAVAVRIEYPPAIVALRVDKRYDAIPRADSTTFDVALATRKYVAAVDSDALAHPRRLEYSMELQYAFISAVQPERALHLADDFIAKVEGNDGKSLYDDFDDYYPWILDNRAAALWLLGRWDEAIAQARRAARRPEHGELNVSQALNLGGYYAMHGEADKALDAISDLGTLSPYGRMQRENILLLDAIQRQDRKKLDEHLDYMRLHKDDALSTYQYALLDADRLDAAARLLIDRLRDTDDRRDALLDMQHYADAPATPLMQVRRTRWRSVIARPEVQAALDLVGRIETFALYDMRG